MPEIGLTLGLLLVALLLFVTVRASGVEIVDEPSFIQAGEKLLKVTASDYLLITRGEKGMTLFEDKEHSHIPTVAREVFDVSGAGDTVIAALTLAVAADASIREAAILANHASGAAVGKLGTAAATPDEILDSIGGLQRPPSSSRS